MKNTAKPGKVANLARAKAALALRSSSASGPHGKPRPRGQVKRDAIRDAMKDASQ